VISSIKKMDYQPNFYHIIPTQILNHLWSDQNQVTNGQSVVYLITGWSTETNPKPTVGNWWWSLAGNSSVQN
jgi:hypothetical protein